jgi:hypothetical protein
MPCMPCFCISFIFCFVDFGVFAIVDYVNLQLLSNIQVFNLLCVCLCVFFPIMLNVYERLMRKTMQ